MKWKAYFDADSESAVALIRLVDGSASDSLQVHVGDAGQYYLQAASLDAIGDADERRSEADVLLESLNGLARTLDSGFEPVSPVGRFEDDDGNQVVLVGIAAEVSRAVGHFEITGGGPPELRPLEGVFAEIIALAGTDKDVRDALRLMGMPGQHDWTQLNRIYEVVENRLDGERALMQCPWVDGAELKAFKLSANHQGVSGDEARHSRMSGEVRETSRRMNVTEGREFVSRLLRNWLESRTLQMRTPD